MAKSRYQGPQGFGEGLGSTFANTAHDVMLQTLRELAAQPERDARIAEANQSIAASKANQARAVADQQMQTDTYEYGKSQRGAAQKREELEQKNIDSQIRTREDAEKRKQDMANLVATAKAADPKLFDKAITMVSKNPLYALLDEPKQHEALMQQFRVLSGAKEESMSGKKPAASGAGGKAAPKPAAAAPDSSGPPDGYKTIIFQGRKMHIPKDSLKQALADGAEEVR